MEPATQPQKQELNIVELIEKNPITRLSQEYNGRLLTKIQESFTGFEQQLFVSSFYCYLNYDKNMDFVVDLDNVWNWLGFQQKYNAIRMIEKYFKIGVPIPPDEPNIIINLFFSILIKLKPMRVPPQIRTELFYHYFLKFFLMKLILRLLV